MRKRIIAGGLAAATGLVVAGVGLGVVEVPPDRVRVPHWVVTVTGLFFLAVGLLVLIQGRTGSAAGEGGGASGPPAFSVAAWLIGGVAVTAFAVVTGWIAVGPGERAFGGSLSLLFVRVGSGSGELSGRIAFGIVALLSTAIAVRGWIWGLRRLRTRSRDEGERAE